MAVQAILASPRFLFRIEQTPSTLKAGQTYRISDHDLASRLSFFIWGSMPDAELLKAASAGTLRTPVGLRQAVEAAARGSAIGSAVDAVCVAVAAPAGRREGSPRSPLLFVLGHDAVAGDGARDGAVRRQPDSRGSAGHRSADRRSHVRERAARQALRHPEHPRRRVPPRDDRRREPPRRARAGQRAAAHLDRRSHLAGAARQVGDGSAARIAAAAAAAQRAAARGDQGGRRRQDALDARAHGDASQESRRATRATA